jgi:natural product precursor
MQISDFEQEQELVELNDAEMNAIFGGCGGGKFPCGGTAFPPCVEN